MKNFFLIVGKDGTFNPEDNRAITDHLNGIYSKPESIDQLFIHLAQTGVKKIAIHFHGGLVSQPSGIEAARSMSKTFQNSNSFPIAFIWKTGILEVAKQVIFDTQTSPVFAELKKIVVKRAKGRISSIAGAKGLGINELEIDEELRKDDPFANLDYVVGAKGGSLIDEQDDEDEDLEEEVNEDIESLDDLITSLKPEENPYLDVSKVSGIEKGSKGLGKLKIVFAIVRIVRRVVKRFRKDTDHGFYCTVIEEIYREFYIDKIGSIIWGEMRNKAKQMWLPNANATPVDSLHVGTYFLKKLDDFSKNNPGVVVDIVGHSAGAIVCCHLFEELKSFSNVKIRKAIFLAPACRVDLFNKFITSRPFTDFYIFTMTDQYEKDDKLVPVLYPHSLLYFVSGLLEDETDAHILGMQRHFDRAPGQLTFLTANGILSVTANGSAVGKHSTSRKHGDFDNDENTLLSIGHIIK